MAPSCICCMHPAIEIFLFSHASTIEHCWHDMDPLSVLHKYIGHCIVLDWYTQPGQLLDVYLSHELQLRPQYECSKYSIVGSIEIFSLLCLSTFLIELMNDFTAILIKHHSFNDLYSRIPYHEYMPAHT